MARWQKPPRQPASPSTMPPVDLWAHASAADRRTVAARFARGFFPTTYYAAVGAATVDQQLEALELLEAAIAVERGRLA